MPKDILQIGQKKFISKVSKIIKVISKIKNTVSWTRVINDLNGKEITGRFCKKNCKRLIKMNVEQKMYLTEKVINCMSNGKDIVIVLIVGLIKNNLYKNESILF